VVEVACLRHVLPLAFVLAGCFDFDALGRGHDAGVGPDQGGGAVCSGPVPSGNLLSGGDADPNPSNGLGWQSGTMPFDGGIASTCAAVGAVDGCVSTPAMRFCGLLSGVVPGLLHTGHSPTAGMYRLSVWVRLVDPTRHKLTLYAPGSSSGSVATADWQVLSVLFPADAGQDPIFRLSLQSLSGPPGGTDACFDLDHAWFGPAGP
jgi:hypothetical protein